MEMEIDRMLFQEPLKKSYKTDWRDSPGCSRMTMTSLGRCMAGIVFNRQVHLAVLSLWVMATLTLLGE